MIKSTGFPNGRVTRLDQGARRNRVSDSVRRLVDMFFSHLAITSTTTTFLQDEGSRMSSLALLPSHQFPKLIPLRTPLYSRTLPFSPSLFCGDQAINTPCRFQRPMESLRSYGHSNTKGSFPHGSAVSCLHSRINAGIMHQCGYKCSSFTVLVSLLVTACLNQSDDGYMSEGKCERHHVSPVPVPIPMCVRVGQDL